MSEPVPSTFGEFANKIPPRKSPLAYRAALALSAFAIVLLPLIYIAIIIATGYGVYLYAGHVASWIDPDIPPWIDLIIYGGPIFAGIMLIVFMMKPLFSRTNRFSERLPLDLTKEPQLRDFIAGICYCVGAPMPVRVEIDCQANASARLRRGFLSLGRRDLVLTIGLPLVGDLNTRQFAGVLAHEFGHFAQTAGMGFIFVISSVNAWFARVVFGRDQWDASLTRLSEKGDHRIVAVILFTRGMIWLTRKILYGLMQVAHAITCLQLRQMEYDADYYAAQVAGSAAFCETMLEAHRLDAAFAVALERLRGLWRNRHLADNFPAFVALQRSQLAPDAAAKLDAAATKKMRWLDTHPTSAQRCTRVDVLQLPGVCRREQPATVLFSDFSALSRTATRHYYRTQLQINFDEGSLVPTENATKTAVDASRRTEAYKRLTGDVLDLARPLLWTADEFAPTGSSGPVEITNEFRNHRDKIARLRPAALLNKKSFGSIQEDCVVNGVIHALFSAKINPADFGLTCLHPLEAENDRITLSSRLSKKANEFRPYEEAVRAWIIDVARAVREPTVAVGFSAGTCDQLIKLTDALAQLGPWFHAMPDWLFQYRVVIALAKNNSPSAKTKTFATMLEKLGKQADASTQNAPTLVSAATPYPFPQPAGNLSAANLLQRSLEGASPDARLGVLLNYVGGLYFRLIGEIALLGEELERKLAADIALGRQK